MLTVEDKARKWGNSLGIVIPSKIAKELNIKEGQPLKIEIKLKQRIDGFGKFKSAKRFKEDSSEHEKYW